MPADHPIHIENLWHCARAASKRFGGKPATVFGPIGLNLEAGFAPYDCTPRNTMTFASTGADGIHWGTLLIPGLAEHERPIVLTSPMDFDDQHWICGENLRDFLELGCAGGGFHGPPYDPTPEVEKFLEHEPLFAFLREYFHLRDRHNIDATVAALQERYCPLLDLPDDQGLHEGP